MFGAKKWWRRAALVLAILLGIIGPQNATYAQSQSLDCHTVDDWDSDFDHDGRFFPIFSGPHDNEWATCQTCHQNPGNFSTFTCLTCHEHNRADTDNDHDEVSGYAYDSALCYQCHPDGRGDD